jgi:hypothetical protein
MAGYFGRSISDLRGVDRTWREAMAVDRARDVADRTFQAMSSGRDDEVVRRALGEVGAEEARRLQAAERSLHRRHILDPKVSDLRDEMAKALRFRRFQMGPDRVRIGDTPLVRVDGMLEDRLERWDLEPTSVPEATLTSFDHAMAPLRRYSSRRTGTTLAAATGQGQILEVAVDDSRTSTLRTPAEGAGVQGLYAVEGGIAVFDGKGLVLRTPATRSMAVELAVLLGGSVVPGGSGPDGTVLWVVLGPRQAPSTVTRVLVPATGDPPAAGPVPVPTGRTVAGANRTSLFLASGLGGGRLERWDPSTGDLAELAPRGSRFLAASDRLVLWQGPLDFSDTGNGGFLHVLHLDTGAHELVGIPRTDAASAAISPDGRTIAVAAGPLAGRLGSVLLLEVGTTGLTGTPGPRVAVDGPALAWSLDSRTLFWRTPDGELAVLHQDGEPRTEVLRTGLHDVTAVVAIDR